MKTTLRRSLVAYATALALVAIAVVPGAALATFGTPENLSAIGGNADEPQVAVGADGATTITWRRDGIIQARTRPAGSADFGPVVNLSAPLQNAASPQVAVGADGATTITWYRRNDAGNYIIQAATRPAGSADFGTVENLSAIGGNAYEPQVAVGADGATTITWRLGGIIQTRTRPAGSDTFGAVEDLSAVEQSAYSPQVAVGADGATTITWRRQDGGSPNNWIIQAATRPAGSATFGAPENLSGDGRDAYSPQVAVGADGATTITWYRYNDASPSKAIIQAATRPAGSATFGAVADLSAVEQSADSPQVAVGADGATTITWRLGGIIQVSTRPAGSAYFGLVADLSEVGNSADSPQVAVGADGATTITWYRDNGDWIIIQAATRPAGSTSFGAPENLSASEGDAVSPQVAVGADGATTITWYRYNGGSPDNSIIQASSSEATLARLSVTRDGLGVGSVTSAPVGINCGATCGAYFAIGSSVTLTATAAAGSVHSGWSGGGCTGTLSTCVVTLSAATSVVASFGVAPAGVAGDPVNTFTVKLLDPVNTFTVKLLKRSVLSITTQLNLPGAGKVVQVGTTRLSTRAGEMAKKARTMIVCRARKTVAKAGKLTIICRLTAKARAARKTQSLKVRLVTTFTPTGGTAKSVTRTLVLKKTGSPAPQNVEPVTG